MHEVIQLGCRKGAGLLHRLELLHPKHAGHADFDIHSGESATIVPRPVAALSRQVVVAVAAAKHHSAAITAEGDLYTWGANRHSQLGYSVDTQPTPRKCEPRDTNINS